MEYSRYVRHRLDFQQQKSKERKRKMGACKTGKKTEGHERKYCW
jgi:hypothetical protein